MDLRSDVVDHQTEEECFVIPNEIQMKFHFKREPTEGEGGRRGCWGSYIATAVGIALGTAHKTTEIANL